MHDDTRDTSVLSKVPAVTLAFWIVKILATTLGETGGDALSMTLKLGYELRGAPDVRVDGDAVPWRFKSNRKGAIGSRSPERYSIRLRFTVPVIFPYSAPCACVRFVLSC